MRSGAERRSYERQKTCGLRHWMKPVFRTVLSKNGFLLVFKALRNQGFSFLSAELMCIKTRRIWNYYFYTMSLFEHDLFINVPCRLPQTPVVSCISRFDVDGVHCKTEYIAPHFCGSSVLRCTLCGTPLLFWRRQRKTRQPRCHVGGRMLKRTALHRIFAAGLWTHRKCTAHPGRCERSGFWAVRDPDRLFETCWWQGLCWHCGICGN